MNPLQTILIANLLILVLASSSCSRTALRSEVETEASLATADWLEAKYGLDQSRDVRRLFARVSQRLSSTIIGSALERESHLALEGEMLNYRWDIFLVQDSKPNAFSLGSGMIFVTKGLLAQLSSEAELAAVIAHEMAHQLLGHTREAIAAQGLESSKAPKIAYSLEREIEADTLSLKILKVARYDLRHATSALGIGFFDKSNTSAPEWLTARFANMEQRIVQHGEFLPATANTREFSKLKRQLFQ